MLLPPALLPPPSSLRTLHPYLPPSRPVPLPRQGSQSHLKDLASAQSVHVRSHEEKDPLSGEERERERAERGAHNPGPSRPPTAAPFIPSSRKGLPGPRKRAGHLGLDHLVELFAEIGHEHDHGGRTPRARAETLGAPTAIKAPAKSGSFQLARKPTNSYLAPAFLPVRLVQMAAAAALRHSLLEGSGPPLDASSTSRMNAFVFAPIQYGRRTSFLWAERSITVPQELQKKEATSP